MKRVLWVVFALCTVAGNCALRPNPEPNSAFRTLVVDSDVVAIRTGGLCHRSPDKERVLKRFEGGSEVRELVQKIVFTGDFATVAVMPADEGEKQEEFALNCLCCGDYTLEFYRGEKLAFAMSLHHWQHVRSGKLAKGADLTLTSESLAALWEIIGVTQEDSASEGANQSPEPTVMSVTPAADASVAPATTVAHL